MNKKDFPWTILSLHHVTKMYSPFFVFLDNSAKYNLIYNLTLVYSNFSYDAYDHFQNGRTCLSLSVSNYALSAQFTCVMIVALEIWAVVLKSYRL